MFGGLSPVSAGVLRLFGQLLAARGFCLGTKDDGSGGQVSVVGQSRFWFLQVRNDGWVHAFVPALFSSTAEGESLCPVHLLHKAS